MCGRLGSGDGGAQHPEPGWCGCLLGRSLPGCPSSAPLLQRWSVGEMTPTARTGQAPMLGVAVGGAGWVPGSSLEGLGRGRGMGCRGPQGMQQRQAPSTIPRMGWLPTGGGAGAGAGWLLSSSGCGKGPGGQGGQGWAASLWSEASGGPSWCAGAGVPGARAGAEGMGCARPGEEAAEGLSSSACRNGSCLHPSFSRGAAGTVKHCGKTLIIYWPRKASTSEQRRAARCPQSS